jgi:hypothetical protein
MSTSIHAPKPLEHDTPVSLDAWRPVHALIREAHDLHELEQAGERGWTPLVAVAGLALFLGTLLLLMIAVAETAYHLAG